MTVSWRTCQIYVIWVSMYNSTVKFIQCSGNHMNLKQYHYRNFKSISYDVGHRGIHDLLLPPREWRNHITGSNMSLRSFYIGFELTCEKLTSFVNKLFCKYVLNVLIMEIGLLLWRFISLSFFSSKNQLVYCIFTKMKRETLHLSVHTI